MSSSIQRLETDRLVLRGIEPQDAESYQRHFNDYEVIRHLSRVVPWPYPADGAETFIRDFISPIQGEDRWIWGIFLKNKPTELIGGVDLWRNGEPENRGFWLGRAFWGLGYMFEAIVPVTDHAFENLGFEKLIFSNALGNTASRKIKEKSGAQFIGTEPAAFVDRQYTERELWELSKSRWKEFRKQFDDA